MRKIKVSDLEVGKIYTDRDGVNAYQYKDSPGFLYDFWLCDYDETRGYFATDDERRFTRQEVESLYVED